MIRFSALIVTINNLAFGLIVNMVLINAATYVIDN